MSGSKKNCLFCNISKERVVAENELAYAIHDGYLVERANGSPPSLITASGSSKLYDHSNWEDFFTYHENKEWIKPV